MYILFPHSFLQYTLSIPFRILQSNRGLLSCSVYLSIPFRILHYYCIRYRSQRFFFQFLLGFFASFSVIVKYSGVSFNSFQDSSESRRVYFLSCYHLSIPFRILHFLKGVYIRLFCFIFQFLLGFFIIFSSVKPKSLRIFQFLLGFFLMYSSLPAPKPIYAFNSFQDSSKTGN